MKARPLHRVIDPFGPMVQAVSRGRRTAADAGPAFRPASPRRFTAATGQLALPEASAGCLVSRRCQSYDAAALECGEFRSEYAVVRLVFVLCIMFSATAAADPKGDALVPPTIARAKAILLRDMTSPEIVEFQNLSAKITKNQRGDFVSVVCGQVNTYGNGGFAGLQPFVYVARPEQVIVISEQSAAETKELVKLLCN